MWVLLPTAGLVWLVLGTWGLVRLATRPPAVSLGAALAHGRPTDPGDVGCTWAETMLRTNDGINMPMWCIDGGDAAGPTIVDLHDWGRSPVAQLRDLVDIAKDARTVILPTLRGHAQGTGRCSLGPRETADLRVLLATLSGDIVLQGTGLGGLVVQACRNEPNVIDVRLDEPWADQGDGLKRILKSRGQVAFPFASLARICLP